MVSPNLSPSQPDGCAPLLVSIEEAARFLAVGVQTLRNRQSLGQLPFPTVKIGNRRLVRFADLSDYVANLPQDFDFENGVIVKAAIRQPCVQAPAAPTVPNTPLRRRQSRQPRKGRDGPCGDPWYLDDPADPTRGPKK